MPQTRRIVSLYQKLISQVKAQETIRSYTEWVILNSGYVKRVDKNYKIPLQLAPAGWHLEKSSWANLEDSARSASIVMAMVNLEEYETLIPGTKISNTGEYIGWEGYRQIITIDSPGTLNFNKRLFNSLPEILFNKLPYKYNNPGMPVYSVYENGITYLIPKSEIARYYFFVGSKIIRLLSQGLYNSEVVIPGTVLLNETTQKKTAIVTMSEGFSRREKIVLAQIAVNEKFGESANYIQGSIFQQHVNDAVTYLQTKFFQESLFRLGTTGIFLDPPYNQYFFVNQIHQTDEKPMFDLLVCKPKIDHRSIGDEDERQKLDTKKYKPKKLLFQPGMDVNLTQDDDVISSDITMLQNPVIQEKFFEVKETIITTPEKLAQDKKYEADGEFKIIVSGKFSTGLQTSKTATSMKAAVENIGLIDKEIEHLGILEKLPAFVLAVKGSSSISSAYYNNTNTIQAFREEFFIVNIGPSINLVILNFDYLGRQFYVFDIYYQDKSMKRTQIIHLMNYGIIPSQQIELIIERIKIHNFSWHETLKNFKPTGYVSKGFNHRAKNQDLALVDVGSNINIYITKHNYQDQERF